MSQKREGGCIYKIVQCFSQFDLKVMLHWSICSDDFRHRFAMYVTPINFCCNTLQTRRVLGMIHSSIFVATIRFQASEHRSVDKQTIRAKDSG